MKRMAVIMGVLGIVLTALLIVGADAQGPAPAGSQITVMDNAINFQGQLTDLDGTPVAPGSYEMRFTICNDPACNGIAWGPFRGFVSVNSQGLFDALLGNGGIGGDLAAANFAGDRRLRVEVCKTSEVQCDESNWDTLTPFQPITGAAVSIGNIRKDVVDTSTDSSSQYILTITNMMYGGGVKGESIGGGIGVAGVGGTGVYGEANNAGAGVDGYSPSGRGVYGHGSGVGVYGEGSTGVDGFSQNGYGVYGHSTANYGVYGTSQGNGSAGVSAINTNTTGTAYGVTGAAGSAWYVPTISAGVTGSAESARAYGVYGVNIMASDGFGVAGIADTTTYLIPPENSSAGLIGQGDYGLFATANDSVNGWAAHLNGKLYVSQGIYAGGTRFSVVDTSQGQRTLAAVESPEVWFEDFGRVTLVNGRAVVKLDSLFAETVNLDVAYHVFLTPLGDCRGLYVTNMTSSSFEVRELGDGTANITFDYRIVAKRLGAETLRMEPAPEKTQGMTETIEVKQLDTQKNPVPSNAEP